MRCDGYAYAFNAKACENCGGKCCIGESGYIWVAPAEIDAIAKTLCISRSALINDYLEKVGYRYSIKEIAYKGGFRCIFFNMETKMCSIYEARPSQCRSFPFWDYFKENINEVEAECPGIIRL